MQRPRVTLHFAQSIDGRIALIRKEIGTDYLDIVLLHCMTDDDWPSARDRLRARLVAGRTPEAVDRTVS